ncbi:MAG: ribonuclease H-like domain-containing protein [Bacteroidales bacterium]|nr:ribonuclease H-like domain-containing protein [Bacteroidales bacterium]
MNTLSINQTNHENLVIFDCETTGLEPHTEWIIQLCAIKVKKENWETIGEFKEYVIPPVEEEGFIVSQGAFEVHGLSKEFILENGKPLKEVAPRFLEFIKGCDVAGYNSNRFDVRFIYNNFKKIGLNLTMDHRFYDVMLMESHAHPRKLGRLYEDYTGKTMEESGLSAHDALSDVKATAIVMQHQMETHNLTWEEIDTWRENSLASPEGSLVWDDEMNGLLFNIGKHKGEDVYDVMRNDEGYLIWWKKNVASDYSLNLAREYCNARRAETKEG